MIPHAEVFCAPLLILTYMGFFLELKKNTSATSTTFPAITICYLTMNGYYSVHRFLQYPCSHVKAGWK
jgi:hypothetical protein